MTSYTASPWPGRARILASLLAVTAVLGARHLAHATTGTVFRDYDADGAYTAGTELGQAGLTVRLYDDDGDFLEATTAADGGYAFDVATELASDGNLLDGARFRLEVTGLPDYLAPAQVGATALPVVAFAGAADVVNIGVANPAHYCEADPDLATTCFVYGAFDGPNTAEKALVTWPRSRRGAFADTPDPTGWVDIGEIGATQGLAYQKATDTLFIGAFAKRHSGYGPLGPGGLYALDLGTGTLSDLAVVPSAGTTAHAADFEFDGVFYPVPGTESLGDLDLSEDGNTLYVVNLATRSLVEYDVTPGYSAPLSPVRTTVIPDPGCAGGAADWRPFGLEVHDGRLYVGGVCSGEANGTVADMRAHIRVVDDVAAPALTFSGVFDFSLDYLRGPAQCFSGSCNVLLSTPWNAWENAHDTGVWDLFAGESVHPQPMLSDLERDRDGSWILGFRDRFGDQIGHDTRGLDASDPEHYSADTGGDLVRVCSTNGTLELQGTGSCPNHHVPGSFGRQDASVVEFYPSDHAVSGTGVPRYHMEATQGGLAAAPRFGDVVTTALDPALADEFTGGVQYFDNTTGLSPNNDTRGYTIFEAGYPSGDFNPPNDFLGKSNGLGDLEYLCAEAPLQIGDRVWFDRNGDGIQDPSEEPLPGVVVTLDCPGTSDDDVATTDADGAFLFAVPPGVACTLSFDVSGADVTGIPDVDDPASLEPTVTGAGGESGCRDSDIDGSGTIAWPGAGPGENDHCLDAGFGPMGTLTLESYEETGSETSDYQTVDDLYYRDTCGSGNGETGFYVGGTGFAADTAYDVACYDGHGDLAFTDTDASADGTGFLRSRYVDTDGLDGADDTFGYGTWTCVVVDDGVTPLPTLGAQLGDASTLVSDTFEVRSWSCLEFTDDLGNPVDGYDIANGADTAYLKLIDLDQNTDPGAIDTVTVTITDQTTGDSVTVTLYETGNDTGCFANGSGGSLFELPLDSTGNPPNGADGILSVADDSTQTGDYTDASDAADQSNDQVMGEPLTLESYEETGSETSDYQTVDDVYYRDPCGSGNGETGFYVGGTGFAAGTAYDVACYDGHGDLAFTDTDAGSDDAGFLTSRYVPSDGLDGADATFAYGTWTCAVVPDGYAPPARVEDALMDRATLVTDTFEVRSWSCLEFTDATGDPVDQYDVPGGDDTAYLSLEDCDENTDPTTIETVTVVVTDPTTGDSETVTLYETGPDSCEFANDSMGGRLGIPLDTTGGSCSDDDGTLCTTDQSEPQATYGDDDDIADESDDLVTTLPVTLARFSSSGEADGTVGFSWVTATELGTIGFHVDGLRPDGRRVRLTGRLVPAAGGDALTPRSYRASAAAQGTERYELVAVDVRGREERHGPFRLGATIGRDVAERPIDWPAARATVAAVPADGGLAATSAAEIRVATDGIQRVTYEQLVDAGVDLLGVSAAGIRVTDQSGELVPVRVTTADVSGGCSPTFGPGSAVVFLGRVPRDDLYVAEGVYRLSAGAGRLAASYAAAAGAVATTEALVSVEVERDLAYGFSAPGADPWYEAALFANGGAASRAFPIGVFGAGGAAGELEVVLWGGADWPGAAPDHHAVVRLNGVTLGDVRFDGLVEERALFAIPAGVLADGENTLEVVVPGDTGFAYDLVQVDRYRVRHGRTLRAAAGMVFSGSADTFEVAGLRSESVEVWAARDGDVVRVDAVDVTRSGPSFVARFAGRPFGSDEATFYVTATPAATDVRAARAEPGDLLAGRADYLVIAHPAFLSGIEPLVAARRAEGRSVKVVDVRDVYARYSSGAPHAGAIRRYVRDAAASLRTEMVLLVGGDTYDYQDHLGLGSVSFVPTPYVATDDIVRFTPADAAYGDVDGDGVPEVAVGRLPARTTEQLGWMVARTLAYRGSSGAVLAADDAPGGSFARISERLAALLPWSATRAYLDQTSPADARAAVLSGAATGQLLSYVGHSGPSAWTADGLLSSDDLGAFGSASTPPLVAQWGCWNTYHVSPNVDGLGPAMLTRAPAGAAAVLGNSTLTRTSSDEEIARRVVTRLMQPGTTLGRAVVDAKRDLAAARGGVADVVLGLTLLGDPALVVR